MTRQGKARERKYALMLIQSCSHNRDVQQGAHDPKAGAQSSWRGFTFFLTKKSIVTEQIYIFFILVF